MRSEVQLLLGPPSAAATWLGALAQLGEHLLCKQGVIGSIPIGSTISHRLPMGNSQDVSRNEDNSSRLRVGLTRSSGFVHRHFDIVNGFFNRCRAGSIDYREAVRRRPTVMTINACNIWLRKKTIIRIICDAECHSHRGDVRIVVGGVDSQV